MSGTRRTRYSLTPPSPRPRLTPEVRTRPRPKPAVSRGIGRFLGGPPLQAA